jgi:hypothetical protein
LRESTKNPDESGSHATGQAGTQGTSAGTRCVVATSISSTLAVSAPATSTETATSAPSGDGENHTSRTGAPLSRAVSPASNRTRAGPVGDVRTSTRPKSRSSRWNHRSPAGTSGDVFVSVATASSRLRNGS